MEVGQKVFVKYLNCRHGEKIHIEEDIISKIGNKYFYLEKRSHFKFCKERMINISEYSAQYQVYMSMEEIKIEEEKDKKTSEIMSHGIYYIRDMSLDDIRSIYNIIKKYKKD